MDFWSQGVWLAPPDSGMELSSGAMPNTPTDDSAPTVLAVSVEYF
jgi:hypothetical protein